MELIPTPYSHSIKASASSAGLWGYLHLYPSQRWQTFQRTHGMSGLRSASIPGGAGSSGIQISKGPALLGTSAVSGGVSSDLGFGGTNAFSMGDVTDVFENKKTTMQNLNDRLAGYLEKVQSLEKANASLELKIHNFLDSKPLTKSRDCSAFYTSISDLQDKILHAIHVNSRINLNITNARIAADDFKVKFENERNIRKFVEADAASLRKDLDELTLARSDLEMNLEDLKGDLGVLKKNHEEELLALQTKMTKKKVNVVVEVKPQQDLSKVLDELRQQYERIIVKNLGDVQLWFQSKTDTLNKGFTKHTEAIGSHKTEITDLKCTLQNLEITLQSVLSQKALLKTTLEDTEAQYSTKLAHYQMQITSEEEVLAQLRAELESKKQDRLILMDIKTKLELEITEYKRLLDRGVGGSGKTTSLQPDDCNCRRQGRERQSCQHN